MNRNIHCYLMFFKRARIHFVGTNYTGLKEYLQVDTRDSYIKLTNGHLAKELFLIWK